MFIFELIHSYDYGYGCFSIKLIGFYSKKSKAENKIKEYRKKPGFRDQPNDFYIKKYLIKSEAIIDDKVYQISYTFENENECEEIKDIGLFFSKENAKKLYNKFKSENKLNFDYEELYFEEYYLDRDYWVSGYFNPFLED